VPAAYSTLRIPLSLRDQTEAIGRIYGYAMKRAGVAAPYVTACERSGILICPTRLPDATALRF